MIKPTYTMRPNIPTVKEVAAFFKQASEEDQRLLSGLLFYSDDEIIISPPLHQKAMVLHTLIFPPEKLTGNYWSNMYHTQKWSTRLGELEKELQKVLVNRVAVPFINRFGHSGYYTQYIPILTREEYVELYNQVNISK